MKALPPPPRHSGAILGLGLAQRQEQRGHCWNAAQAPGLPEVSCWAAWRGLLLASAVLLGPPPPQLIVLQA